MEQQEIKLDEISQNKYDLAADWPKISQHTIDSTSIARSQNEIIDGSGFSIIAEYD